MSKTVLVTGGAGFIGSNFVRYLYNKYPDYRILVLDALTYAGNVENLPVNLNEQNDSRVQLWYGNVRNAEVVDALVSEADYVVHFAAETHVTRSIYDNLVFFETDVIGTQILSNVILKHKNRIKRFIHISTSEVYGTASEGATMKETHPLLPMSPYAAAKAGADRLVFSYWATYELPVVIVRPFNNYGSYQHLEKAVPRFITSCILNEPIRLHGDGMAARDFIHAEDTCNAVDTLLHTDKKVNGEVFNIASGTDRSMLSVAQDIVKMMGRSESLISFVGERPGQVFRHTGDIEKIQKWISWSPKITWEKGLEKTIQWYKDNQKWWEKQLWLRAVPIITKTGKRELH
jgi:dTDP-glucose 4,6-dehydratase